jgi:soluble lytic murein transglycosylase-like protein
VKGNLFDPETNIRCATAYSRWLCKEMGHCEIVPNLVAYNAGGEGVKRVRNLSQHPYAHGIFKILGLRA